jgi:hypothetical protein
MRIKVIAVVLAVLFCAAGMGYAQEDEKKDQPEKDIGFSEEIPEGEQTKDVGARAGKVRSLEDRLVKLEAALDRDVTSENWYDRIQVSGLIEVEASYENLQIEGEEDEDSSIIDLTTVELVFDVNIHKHVDGHVMLKYEVENVFVDEGFITLIGTEDVPAYLIAGRQYVPFGYYDSMFVTDPNTLLLGETVEGAVVAGYRFGGNEMVDITIGAFNGQVDKIDSDDHIDGFVAGIFTNPLEGLNVGASYTSNLAASAFSEVVLQEEIDSLVGGWSAYITYEFLERFKVIGEYVAAIDSFAAGEVYDEADVEERQPSAWNVEAGMQITEDIGLALRYGGSDDGGFEYLPETQYGVIVNYGFFTCNLALEYMHNEFESDVQEFDRILAQLAVSF